MKSFAPFLAAVPLVFAVAACQVTTDSDNRSAEVSYNETLAANTVDDIQNFGEDVANTAENVADDIGNDVDKESAKVDEKIVKDDNASGNRAN